MIRLMGCSLLACSTVPAAFTVSCGAKRAPISKRLLVYNPWYAACIIPTSNVSRMALPLPSRKVAHPHNTFLCKHFAQASSCKSRGTDIKTRFKLSTSFALCFLFLRCLDSMQGAHNTSLVLHPQSSQPGNCRFDDRDSRAHPTKRM